jgi:hypothetical protein
MKFKRVRRDRREESPTYADGNGSLRSWEPWITHPLATPRCNSGLPPAPRLATSMWEQKACPAMQANWATAIVDSAISSISGA